MRLSTSEGLRSEYLLHLTTMKLLPLAWIEKSIDRRVNTWCQKNRWTKLRVNSEGLWVAIPPGETEHMEVPPVAYVSQSQLKFRAIRPYVPFLVILTVIVGGYLDLSWQLRSMRQKNEELSKELKRVGHNVQAIQKSNSAQAKPANTQVRTAKNRSGSKP